MILTAKQEEGLKIAVERHRNNERYTVISGYAGTGKSTLVKFIIEALGVNKNRVCYATYTGKAAEVLRKKGNDNVQTLHRLLYDHKPLPAGGFMRIKKTLLEYDIVVVDEVSMVPKEMIDLLFKHKVYVICLGDPFQIPPIEKDTDNHLLDHPHVFLDEIMRQAAESEIIRLSMDIRAMKPLELYKGTNVQVVDRSQFVEGMLTWADQVITGTNQAKDKYNNIIRGLLGFQGGPQHGDKLICTKNDWDEVSMNNGDALVNGTIGYIQYPEEGRINFPYFLHTSVKGVDVLNFDFKTDSDDIFMSVNADKNLLLEGKKSLDWRDEYKLLQVKHRMGNMVPHEFTYGYAITGHKAQGSEWNKVTVIEETFPRGREEHARWLYTCATRASEKLVIVRN